MNRASHSFPLIIRSLESPWIVVAACLSFAMGMIEAAWPEFQFLITGYVMGGLLVGWVQRLFYIVPGSDLLKVGFGAFVYLILWPIALVGVERGSGKQS